MNSVVSYPDRGPWGSSKWRGNCSGYLIKAFLEHFRPSFFVDPMMGSGTSQDVSRELGIRYQGLDLHSGFNLVKDSLIQRLGGDRPDYIFLHPPYGSIIRYSGSVWGDKPHPDDLSHCVSKEDFLAKMQMALYNLYDALKSSANYTVLVGDVRKSGEFWSIQSDLIQMMPGKVESVVIKHQHNCVSDRTVYRSDRLIPCLHEYAISARKDRVFVGMLDAAVTTSQKLVSLSNATWRAVVGWALTRLGGKASLGEIYEAVAEGAHDRIRSRPNWEAKVRQTLGRHFSNVERGIWEMRTAG